MKILGVLILACVGFTAPHSMAGQAKPQQPPQAAPPTIPSALVTKTFKAQAELAQAQLQAKTAQELVQQKTQAMQQIFAELQSVCGEKFQPQLDTAGDPVCAAKPEEHGKTGK